MFIYRLYDDDCSADVIVITNKSCKKLIEKAVEDWHNEDNPDYEQAYVADYLEEHGIKAKFYELGQLDSIYW